MVSLKIFLRVSSYCVGFRSDVPNMLKNSNVLLVSLQPSMRLSACLNTLYSQATKL